MSALKSFREIAAKMREQWEEVDELLTSTEAAMAAISGDDAEPPKDTGPADPAPAPPGGQGGEAPEFRSQYVDPQVWRAAERESPKVGVRPETLVAIQVLESDWYTSRLFRGANNVGGVKYRPDLVSLGHIHGSYKATDGNVYAKWPTWLEGVAGHAQFLAQKRYDVVRTTESVTEEVRGIHEAGYAEHSLSWLQEVTALAVKFEKERAK